MLNTILGSFSSGVAAGGGASYESIATVTLTSTASTVTFSSIPQTYTHLQLRVLSAQANATQAARLWANSDTTTTNYWTHYFAGNGSITYSTNSNENYALWDSGTTNGFYATVIDILDYTNTNKKKTIRSLQGYDLNGSGAVGLLSMLWNNTSAITSLQFADNGSAFQSGGSYALYGIKGA